MPLNERSPLIRRQSVSRPDLWPHSQVDDPRQVRNFTRSRRSVDCAAADLPDSMTQRKSAPQSPSTTANGSSGSPSDGALSSITEGGGKAPPVEFMTGKNNFVPIAQRKIIMPSLKYRPGLDFDPCSDPAGSINNASLSSSSRTRPDPSGALGTSPKIVRRTNRSIKPKQI